MMINHLLDIYRSIFSETTIKCLMRRWVEATKNDSHNMYKRGIANLRVVT